MESYIEIAWIINLLICLHAYQLGFAYMNQYISHKKKVILSLVSATVSVCSFYPYSWLIIILYEISLLILFRYQIKAIFLSDWFRFLWIISYMIFHSGTLRYTAYFPSLEFPLTITTILILWLCIELVTQSHKVRRRQFYVDIQIEDQWLKGYYDSGNLMMIHQLPCVFIKKDIYENVSSQSELSSRMHTMNQQSIIQGKVVMMMYRNKMKQKVVLIPTSKRLPGNCDCLLNMKNQGGEYV